MYMNKSFESAIMIKASDVIRQTADIFRAPGSSFLNKASHALHIGTIYAPSKCNIKYGAGDFLFLARMRLGKALLFCSQRWENFITLWKRSSDTGDAPCSLVEITNQMKLM